MADRFVVLKIFASEVEAEATKGRLESLGIEAFVSKDDAGGMRPHLQLSQGVRLLVSREDMKVAEQILSDESGGQNNGPWQCSGCGESLEGQFTECWKCGSSRSDR